MKNETVIYQVDEFAKFEVKVDKETAWSNHQQIITLFDRDTKTIDKQINNALKEELPNVQAIASFAIVQKESNEKLLNDIMETTGRNERGKHIKNETRMFDYSGTSGNKMLQTYNI